MPAPVLVVHDEQDVRELAVSALRAAFLEVVGFADPIAALDVIETDFPRPCIGYACGARTWQAERRRFGAHGQAQAAGHKGCVRCARRE